MRVRVCIVRGTWQFVSLSAALAEHHLRGEPRLPSILLLGGSKLSPERRAALTTLAEQSEQFDRFVWIDDLTGDLLDADLPDSDLAVRMASLRVRIGHEVGEVWTNSPRSGQNWLVHEAYPEAGVIAYEDGLIMYLQHRDLLRSPEESRASFLRRAVRFQRQRLRDSLLRTRLGERVWRRFGSAVNYEYSKMRAWRAGVSNPPGAVQPSAAYLILAPILPPDPFYRGVQRVVRPALVDESLRRVACASRWQDDGVPGPRALVLAQKFRPSGARPEDVQAYAGVIEKLSSSGFSVYWKEHPRSHAPILSRLQDALPGVPIHSLHVDATMPVEIALAGSPMDLIVSGWSSTLFYAQLLWGTEVASFAPAPDPAPHPNRLLLRDLVRRRVPDLDSWLASRSSSLTHGLSAGPLTTIT
jgi:hypothetical protein